MVPLRFALGLASPGLVRVMGSNLPELYRVLALFAFEHISDSVRMAGREKHRRSILRPIFRFFRNHSRKTEGPILTRRPKGMIVTYMTWLKHKIGFHKVGSMIK